MGPVRAAGCCKRRFGVKRRNLDTYFMLQELSAQIGLAKSCICGRRQGHALRAPVEHGVSPSASRGRRPTHLTGLGHHAAGCSFYGIKNLRLMWPGDRAVGPIRWAFFGRRTSESEA